MAVAPSETQRCSWTATTCTFADCVCYFDSGADYVCYVASGSACTEQPLTEQSKLLSLNPI